VTTAATFRDRSVEETYRREGFVVIPFLDADEVEHLRAGYRALVPPGDHGLTVDFMRPDRRYMYEILELVEPVLGRHLPEAFTDHRTVLNTFVTKHPGPASNMYLHEDRTLVDERHFRSGTLWIPLVDVGPALDNGTIELIPRSHLLNRTMSGTDTPELFRPYEAYLLERLRPITVPAGHALYYDMRTLHASDPNRSSEPREALVCAVAPRRAELLHVIGTSRRHRRVHRIDERFFLDVHPHTVDSETLLPHWPLVHEFDDNSRLAAEDVAEALGPGPADRPPGPLRRPVTPTGIRVAERRLPLLDADLPLPVADLPPPSGPLGLGLQVERGIGSVGAVALRAACTDGAPPWVDVVRPLATLAPVAAAIAVAARSTAVIHLGAGRPPGRRGPSGDCWRIDLVDVAPGTAELAVAGSPMALDESMSLEVDAGVTPLELTNRGVGVVTLLVTSGTAVPVAHRSVGTMSSRIRSVLGR
jgi:ectoine hydroxylase-related dioxygenase (phytanoyl-CoA dioxygenase family)